MDELLEQFVVEAAELTQQAVDDLLSLEREPGGRSHIESLFRAVHTLKGSVGLFDFGPLQRALFAAEDVLTVANKSGELEPTAIDPLVAIVDWTERCVRAIAETGSLPEGASADSTMLIAALGSGVVDVAPAVAVGAMPSWAADLLAANPEGTLAIRYVPRPDCFFSGDDPIALMSSIPDLFVAKVTPVVPWPGPDELDPFRSNLAFEAVSAAPVSIVEHLFRLLPDQVTVVERVTSPVPAEIAVTNKQEIRRTLRVDVERVDALVDIVGELFVAKNAMSTLVAQARQLDGGLGLARNIAASQQDLDRLSTRLQRAATGVRMVPLNDTFRRLPRLVREVSVQLAKPLDLTVEGGAVEADKSIVDALFEPLLHILRNAIDHGIEARAVRVSQGKPERGQISVRVKNAGYRVEVLVSDDGAGIDDSHVRAMAVQKGIVSTDQAASLDRAGVIELLFHSGFSTASTISDISGRGVGMDAVRRDVQKLGGRATIESELGRGTTVRLSLPTSFAVARIMIVDAAGDTYGIPMDGIAETVRIGRDAINHVRSGEAFVLRDRTVPVVRLNRLLGLPTVDRPDELMLVADVGGTSVGLVIDGIGDQLETVLRPVTGLLKTVNGVSGTTVLGDGNVVMVLDLEALIQ